MESDKRIRIGTVEMDGTFVPSPGFLAASREMGRSPLDCERGPGAPAGKSPIDLESGHFWEAGAGVTIVAVREDGSVAIYGIVDEEKISGREIALRAEHGRSPAQAVEYDLDPAEFMPQLIRAKR